jgi:hypothetical protein
MPSNTIVPASQIAALKTGLDSILKPIQQALQSKVYAENLPIIGSLISSAAAKGQAALQQFGSLETNVFNALNAFNNVGTNINTIQTAINTALVNAGFPAGGVAVSLTGGTLTLPLNDTVKNSFSTALGTNFGLPGLGFQTNGTATTKLDYTVKVSGAVDASGNFSVSTPNNGPALSVGLDVTAPTFTASSTLGTADSILGGLRFGAINQGSSLQGTVSLDTSGNATFTGNANLNVQLTSDMGTAALPSISADLLGGWSFNGSTFDPNNAASFGDTPTISLDNVTYKLGDFVDNFLDPVLSDANALLQSAPIQTALKIFDTNVDFLGGTVTPSDPGAKGDMGLIGTLWHNLDVAGAVDADGNDIADGHVTLVDFLKLAGVDVTPIVQFLTAVQDVQNWVTALSGASFGSTSYDLGSFSIPDDVRGAIQQISEVTPVQTTAAQDLGALLDSWPDATPAGAGGMTAGQALQSLLNSKIFSFPIISNPVQAVQFLLGGTVDLFDADLPPASINIGAINAAGVPTSLDTLFSLPIPIGFIPPQILSLDLTLGAAFRGSAAIDFGYDTKGVTDFKNSGFTAPADLLDGLFVQAQTINGTAQPVVQLAGAVQLGATLEAGFIGSAGAGGDIGGNLDLTFAQPGKNYLSTLVNEIKTNPFGIFDASGQVTAGFEAAAKVLFFPAWTFYPTPIVLAQFNTAATAQTASSGPAIPVSTTWVGPAQGLANVGTNWNPSFANIGLTNYYGDATIKSGSNVVFDGTAIADLTALSLGANAFVLVDHSVMAIENSKTDTTNSGSISLDDSANLLLQGGMDNIGAVVVKNGTIIVNGLMHLYGGGSLLNTDSADLWLTGADANSFLINTDNTVGGSGTIGVALLNSGNVVADGKQRLVLSGSDSNSGDFIASGNSAAAGSARVGGLEIQQSLDHTGGTLVAVGNGLIQLDNGVTIYGGELVTGADSSVISATGSVVLNGGTAGMVVAGAVMPGAGSTLTLTGSISSVAGKGIVGSGNGTVLLSAVTLVNGLLDAAAPASGTAGTMAVSGTATLDGLAIDGTLAVASGNTLVVDGTLNPVLASGGIELSGGTLIIGNAATDAATFGIALPGSAAGTFGSLVLDDGDANLVTGADAGSSLTNSWLIAGSGTLGNGQLAVINTSSGTIGAIGSDPLVLNTGAAVLNAGLIGALAGTLDLQSNVANAGGTIGALAGVVLLDGATVGGGTIATTLGGSIRVAGHGKLDGTASAVTIAPAGQAAVDAGDTLTLAGTITNHGTISVLGNATVGSLATLGASGSVTLNGGGVVALADISGNGADTSQAITGAPAGKLDNIDNTIRGYGEVGIGDGSLTVTNEAKGTIDATAGGSALVLNTGSIALVNHGLLEATSGGTLDLRGSIVSTGATLSAAGGIALLDGVRFRGGTIVTTGTGSVRSNGGTLDGSANPITVSTGAEVAVDAGDVLTTIGTIINDGTMHSTGGDFLVASGTLTNLGQLRADLGGVLDLHANVGNAGGTIAAGTGVVDLDGDTVTNGLLTSDPASSGFINALGSATLAGSSAVAAGVTAAPTNGLLNTGTVAVQSGNTLTLRGTITNRDVIGVAGDGSGNAPATLRASGTVALTGGGTLALVDSSGSGTDTSQVVTGTAPGDTLDNLNNIISGPGELGTGDRLFTLINEAAGTVDATDGTLIVNTGTNAVVNKGLMDASTGVLDLRGTITNSGTIDALGGSVEIDGAIITGGTLTSSAGGAINVDGTGTLNAVTLAQAAVVDDGNALPLQGTIINHTTVGFTGASFFNLPATLLVSGAVSLAGGGAIVAAYTNILGAPAPSSADALDNINNTIDGYGQIGAGDGALTLTNEVAGTIEAVTSTLTVNTGAKVTVNKGLFDATTGVLDLHGAVTNTGGTIAADGGVTELDGATITGGTFITSAGEQHSDRRSGRAERRHVGPTRGGVHLRRQPAHVVRRDRQPWHTERQWRSLLQCPRHAADRRHGGAVRRRHAGDRGSVDQRQWHCRAAGQYQQFHPRLRFDRCRQQSAEATQRSRRGDRGRRRRTGGQYRHQRHHQPWDGRRDRRHAGGARDDRWHRRRHADRAGPRHGRRGCPRHHPAGWRHDARRDAADGPHRSERPTGGKRQRRHAGRHRRCGDAGGGRGGGSGCRRCVDDQRYDRQPRDPGGRWQQLSERDG